VVDSKSARREFLPFHLPQISTEEIDAVVETMKSGWLTTGPQARRFEEDFAAVVGCDHAIAVNSATAALHLALDAIGLTRDDEVLVPTMTFAATAEVVAYFGARPVLVDCEPDTLNLSVEHAEELVTERTRAVIPVHFAGHACSMTSLIAMAHIEDAAHALPAFYRGRHVGTDGDIGCFSFYATKTITTGEGGMITTDNAEYADRMRIMRLHGISHNAWNRYSAEGSWYYEILQPGYKYNLTDIAAAIGIEQLKKHRRFRDVRSRIAALYDRGFADLPEIVTPPTRENVDHAWHLYVIRLDLDRLRINRNQFIEALKADRIGTSVHFIPLHLHPFYRQTLGYRPEDLPRASDAYQRIISLPIYPGMTDADVEHVIDSVTRIVHRHRR
jgi:perosamine synthetase